MEKVISMRKRRRTWKEYRAIRDRWSGERLRYSPDHSPRPTYAPELPRDPYSSPHKEPVWCPPVTDYEEYDGN